jgi:D-glucosaminate-6-phosphate ammonia-lyase
MNSGMISRRNLLKWVSALPLGALLPGCGAGARSVGAMRPAAGAGSIYESIGVRPLINARGTVTVIGATRMLPEVTEAMERAVGEYVQLDELMDGVGRRLAELTGAEWGCITSGASAAITVGTAGCVTGGDPDRLWRVPDLTGMKDEVIIPAYSRTAYDAAARAVGVKMVEVATADELRRAAGPRTAMVLVVTGGRSEEGPLSLREIASIVKPLGIPILADAAAEILEVPNPHLAQGADLVAYSGGKALRGPQCAGLLIGREDLVRASYMCSAPHHGFGRGFKVGREEVMGMLAAVETWSRRDHPAENRIWTSWLNRIAERLAPIDGLRTEVRQAQGRSNRYPGLAVHWDPDRIPLTGYDVERLLWDGIPRVAVGGAGSFLPFPPNMEPTITINPSQLEEREALVVADRVFRILSDPPRIPRLTGAPAFDVSGTWDVRIRFAATTGDQTFVFRQSGNEIAGTHHASYAPRELAGTLHGPEILVRSSYTGEGVRLNFEFTGTVTGDTMTGRVSMGEYGVADWLARRRA